MLKRMILRNEFQYERTKAQLAQLEAAHAEAQNSGASDTIASEVARRAHSNGIALLMGDLRDQIAEYEKLRDGKVKTLALDAILDQLPETLVRARIARGWTQRDLAQELGTSEQQVQKDEAGAYARASLEKLGRIATVLGVTFSGQAKFTSCKGASPLRSVKRAALRRQKRDGKNAASPR